MRHRVAGRILNRTPSHRIALRRNMVQSLFEHGELRTTLPKAKHIRPMAERLITLAIDGSLAARQRAIAILGDRSIIPAEHRDDYDRLSDAKREKVLRSRSGRRYRQSTTKPGVKFTAESVIHKLFAEIGPQMKRRNEKRGAAGGYTRLIKLADRRLGDGGDLAIIQLVSEDDAPRKRQGGNTERRRRANVRYAFYAGKKLDRRGQRRGAKDAAATAVAEPPADESPKQQPDTAGQTPQAGEPQAEQPEEKKEE